MKIKTSENGTPPRVSGRLEVYGEHPGRKTENPLEIPQERTKIGRAGNGQLCNIE